ncbi:hypothetical protein F5Y10DRAFT_284151 [Nemania abortiva]|nr:hypothetical protein F5Y10DRAFT_284151 [Nemania abortiva]
MSDGVTQLADGVARMLPQVKWFEGRLKQLQLEEDESAGGRGAKVAAQCFTAFEEISSGLQSIVTLERTKMQEDRAQLAGATASVEADRERLKAERGTLEGDRRLLDAGKTDLAARHEQLDHRERELEARRDELEAQRNQLEVERSELKRRSNELQSKEEMMRATEAQQSEERARLDERSRLSEGPVKLMTETLESLKDSSGKSSNEIVGHLHALQEANRTAILPGMSCVDKILTAVSDVRATTLKEKGKESARMQATTRNLDEAIADLASTARSLRLLEDASLERTTLSRKSLERVSALEKKAEELDEIRGVMERGSWQVGSSLGAEAEDVGEEEEERANLAQQIKSLRERYRQVMREKDDLKKRADERARDELERKRDGLNEAIRSIAVLDGDRSSGKRKADGMPLEEGPAKRGRDWRSEWKSTVNSLSYFMLLNMPVADEDGSMSDLAAIRLILGAAADASMVERLSECIEQAEEGKWYCFEEVVLNGVSEDALIDKYGCFRHHNSGKDEECYQIRRGGIRGEDGLERGGIVCRLRSKRPYFLS